MQKKYTSFEELNQDLEIAKLKSKIDVESLKNKYEIFKNITVKETSPKKLFSNATRQVGTSILNFRGVLFQLLVNYTVKRILKKQIR